MTSHPAARTLRRRRSAALVVLCLSTTACYEATSFRMSIRSPPTTLNCARVADQVFFGAAYERRSNISGPDIFYTPRVSSAAKVGLGWGIAVWLKGQGPNRQPDGGRCDFELEALSVEPGCGVQCLYSPQRGADFDDTLKDMSRRLSAAFGDTAASR